MKKEYNKLDLIAVFIVAIILGFSITGIIFNPQLAKTKNFNKGYKAGQIDALNGIQNWDKVIKPDTIYFKIK